MHGSSETKKASETVESIRKVMAFNLFQNFSKAKEYAVNSFVFWKSAPVMDTI